MAAITDAFAVVAALVGKHGCCDLGLLLDIKKVLRGHHWANSLANSIRLISSSFRRCLSRRDLS